MLNRCRNPNVKDFRGYGAKGITVCSRWLRFENFISDMGEAPAASSLDRIDSRGPYGPENCRWATPKQQARNMSRNVHFNYEGREVTIAELSELTGIKYANLRHRIAKGLSREQILSKRLLHNGGPKK